MAVHFASSLTTTVIGRKPIVWKPKMHLDDVSLDDVRADTN